MTSDFVSAVYLTRGLKEQLDIPVMWGGKHPSAKPEQAVSFADMVCIGEGEDALAEVLERIEGGKDYHNTKNIWLKNKGTIVKNPLRPLIENLDLISFPDYSFDNHYISDIETKNIMELTPSILKEDIIRLRPNDLITYETLWSRGCPFNCSYCFSFRKMYKGQKYLRFRSLEHLMGELELITRKLDYIQKIWLVDDNIFALPVDKIEEFGRVYKKRIGLPLFLTGHPRHINEKKLSYLVDAGLKGMTMGVQTGSRRTQELYNRRVPDRIVLNAVQAINRFKKSLFPSYDVIVDNPYETNEDLVDTIKLLLKVPKPRYISVFSLTFFPGTELYERAKKDGILPDDDDEITGYRKNILDFSWRKKRYLNLVFLLLNKDMPNFIIRLLINKYVIRILDRPLVISPVYRIISIWRRRKK